MGWKTVIIGTECSASISLNRMKITIGSDYQTIPLSDIDTVIFANSKMTMTIPLIAQLIDNNINTIICDNKNDPIGAFYGFNTHCLAFKQLYNQINWKITTKKRLWTCIVKNKIQSEIESLIHLNKSKDVIESLINYKNSIYSGDQTNREGASARLYFKEMFGPDFNRDEDNAINYALNYGYKIIASYISKCIVSRGLLTQLGIHHIGESNPFNLTYDFIECFRSIIDIWVCTNIKDKFDTADKIEIIQLMEIKVNISGKWIRLNDGIEDIIDSYLLYLNEKADNILRIDISKGFRRDDI